MGLNLITYSLVCPVTNMLGTPIKSNLSSNGLRIILIMLTCLNYSSNQCSLVTWSKVMQKTWILPHNDIICKLHMWIWLFTPLEITFSIHVELYVILVHLCCSAIWNHLHESISCGARDVILHSKIRWEDPPYAAKIGSVKLFWLSIIA